mgnify:CR=1 FL=1
MEYTGVKRDNTLHYACVLRPIPRGSTAPKHISLHMLWHWRDESIVQAICAPVMGRPLLYALQQALYESMVRVIAPHAEHINGAYAQHVRQMTPLMDRVAQSIAGITCPTSTAFAARDIARDLHLADQSILPPSTFPMPCTTLERDSAPQDLPNLSTDTTYILSPPHAVSIASMASDATWDDENDVWATPCASPIHSINI